MSFLLSAVAVTEGRGTAPMNAPLSPEDKAYAWAIKNTRAQPKVEPVTAKDKSATEN